VEIQSADFTPSAMAIGQVVISGALQREDATARYTLMLAATVCYPQARMCNGFRLKYVAHVVGDAYWIRTTAPDWGRRSMFDGVNQSRRIHSRCSTMIRPFGGRRTAKSFKCLQPPLKNCTAEADGRFLFPSANSKAAPETETKWNARRS
jgi:hypothetical protein